MRNVTEVREYNAWLTRVVKQTRRKRLKSALYLKLKKRKKFF